MARYKILFLSVFFVFCVGCQGYYDPYAPATKSQAYRQKTYSVDITGSNYSDKYVDITLTPHQQDYSYKYFTLNVVNKTNHDIKISWNDTYFIENDNANGGFMFEGVQYMNRNAPKQDWLIFKNTSASKDIYPCAKVVNFGYDRTAAQMGLPTGWGHGIMTNGIFGAYIKVNGEKFSENVKVTATIKEN